MKKKIKITFCDFWDNFVPNDNYFYNLLSLSYDVEINEKEPDLVFYSVFGNRNLSYGKDKFVKIFFTGENIRPDFTQCDYSFSFDYNSDTRNFRLPLWVLHFNWFNRPYIESRDHAYLHNINDFFEKKINNKNKFCSFIVSNPNCTKRINFAIKLYKHKKIDCPGRVLNNMPLLKGRGDHVEKLNFLKDYKFNLCFENSSYEGYCTEKIIHSMFMNCIPIYHGDPLVNLDFNNKSFLNLLDFDSDEHLIEEILEIDKNPKKYKEIIEQPWFVENKFPEKYLPENVLNFLKKIIKDNVG